MDKNLILSRLSSDERSGIYVAPNLPAVKLGKILMNDRRIAQPGDVIAMHLDEGIFGKTAVIITDSTCFYEGGSFPLAEIKFVKTDGKILYVSINNLGNLQDHSLKAGNENAARLLGKFFEDLSHESGRSITGNIATSVNEYAGFDKNEVAWLKLRDEVMKTIDMLYDKFNDGKISLIEYEETKTELLSRL